MSRRDDSLGSPATPKSLATFWLSIGAFSLVGLLWMQATVATYQHLGMQRSTLATYAVDLPADFVSSSDLLVFQIGLTNGSVTCEFDRQPDAGSRHAIITCLNQRASASGRQDVPGQAENIPALLVKALDLRSVPRLVSLSNDTEGAHVDSFGFRTISSLIIGLLAAALGGFSMRRELASTSLAARNVLPWVLIGLPPVLAIVLELTEVTQARYLGASWQFVVGRLVVAPITEELFFRAGLLSLLLTRLRARPAIALSALVFGFSHELDPLTVASSAVSGLFYGWLWVRYRSVSLCIVAHASMNSNVLTSSILANL